MELDLIYGGTATVEDLINFNEKIGLEFVIMDGVIVDVLCPR